MEATFPVFRLSVKADASYPGTTDYNISLPQRHLQQKNNDASDCFSSTPTIRKVVNKPAVVKVTGTIYGAYLVEQGSIDTKLIPCNLSKEFIQNDLQVVISGDVKKTPSVAAAPCCAENFVIEKISK